jgi:D-serine deaminase-like pyridoxal phosphate-dependent protein
VMTLNDLPTPALVIDATIVRRNLDRFAEYSRRHNLAIRPHTKTHKSRKLAAMQLESGCRGLTVAKVGEAEVMADVCDDLFLAYPALDSARTARIAKLAATKTVRVGIDSREAAQALGGAARSAGTKIGILVDFDVGLGRTGVQSPDATWRLAELVLQTDGLRLDGLMCYPGHIWNSSAEQVAPLREVAARLEVALGLWKQHGVEANIVSGGSTPTALQSHLVPQYTEIRPGTYIFNDLNTVRGGWASLDDCAARIVCTVISNAVPGQVVIDAGSKTLTSDRCVPAPDSGHGHLVEFPQAVVTKLSEEHGQVDVRNCDRPPQLGQRVTVIPNHICPCLNLQDAAWWLEDERLEPLPIDARGKLS